ncbi:class I SAM-dependent methyltransferase [Chroogloeocystis siderophila]|uniref:Ubiquinone/menaquinone biosynthesis protein n=1 Tax=Chroogloeocystis siderophila 5.2 s.c.1 TaxID=247279 RepID=A0A1U7HU56_9CHRO|nr:class I SAM-dependent methyltransferase [Chroogloeocystis siderophila]OKH27116.1 ubiquinone/menaquinone biosynthesis protein [Chroogloeocystis siderophila 5.2 s.c.1]
MSFDFSTASDSIANPLSYFSDRGDDYEKYRPIYPASAIDTILSGLESPTQITAVDVGAGTGIGARLLADRGVRVVAIEPNEDMRRAATPHEGVDFLAGTAEQTPLKNASVDLVTSFQAFHWFDFDKSLKEFRRILKASGRLALIWSFWDQDDLVSKDYTRLVFEASKDREHQSQSGVQLNKWFKSIRYQLFWQGLWLPYFTNLRRHEFVSSQDLDFTGLVGLARSQGFTPSEGKGLEKLMSDLAVFQQRFCDRQSSVRLIYRTRLYTAISNHP